jgi:hypothetical protein
MKKDLRVRRRVIEVDEECLQKATPPLVFYVVSRMKLITDAPHEPHSTCHIRLSGGDSKGPGTPSTTGYGPGCRKRRSEFARVVLREQLETSSVICCAKEGEGGEG